LGYVVAAGLGLAVLTVGGVMLAGCERDDDTSVPVVKGTSSGAGGGSDVQTDATRPASKPAADEPARRPAVNLLDDIPDDAGDVKPDKNLAKVIQTIAAFDHPAGSALSADNQFLFVTNASKTITDYRYARGSISKLEVQPDGRLKMVKADFVTKLHAPIGIAALNKATGKFPVGSLFVSVGTTSAVDEKNEHIVEIKKYNPGVMVIDPASGKTLGFIAMGPGTAVAKRLHHPVISPAGLCFDPSGNLYVADCGNTGKELNPEVFGFPELLRVKAEHLDAFSDNREGGEVMTLPFRHMPMAVYYSKADDAIYWTTSSGDGPAGGGVNRMLRDQYPLQNSVNNILGGEGPLMGLVITPKGGLVVSRQEGDLKLMNGKVLTNMFFNHDRQFASPMGLTLLTLPNGNNILYVPEQQPSSGQESTQRLRVVLLPSAL
jgi:hypothetical protein